MNKKFVNMRSDQKGFSLVELLVATAVGCAVMGMTLSLYTQGREIFEQGVNFQQVHEAGRTAMDWMSRDIRVANQVVSSVTIGANTYTTGPNEVVLAVPGIDGSGYPIDDVSDYIVYHLNADDPTILERTVDADASSSRAEGTRTIARNVESFTLSVDGEALSGSSTVDNIDIALVTSTLSSKGREVLETVNTNVTFRNYTSEPEEDDEEGEGEEEEPEEELTCADGIQYCTTSGECTAQGYYWYDGTCNAEPEEEPEPEPCRAKNSACSFNAQCCSNNCQSSSGKCK
jgi:prepilin-type N-terminal cleavage/methylation domain-containing protein